MLKALLDRIDTLPKGNITIAIDGRCASGKTTLAAALSQRLGAGVVHMDDFFLPVELRTAERLKEPGGNVHYERFLTEVTPHLNKGEAFTYRRFDCSRMELGGSVYVPSSPIVIVEGAYSCHPILKDAMSLKVFVDVNSSVQLERIGKRNGWEKRKVFQEKWIPMEEVYFSAFQIMENADIILRNEMTV